MDGKRDVRNLLIFILCVAVFTFGGYIMYKILDPVDQELSERGRYFLRLYMNSDGTITDEENEYEILKFEVFEKRAKLISYVKDDYNDELKYVLYSLNGLKLYNVKEKTIEPLIEKENYQDGEYYLHLDNSGNNIIGYFFVSNDGTKEYYKKLIKEKLLMDDLKPEENRFVDNSYGNYFIISKGDTCESGMYLRDFEKEKPLLEGKVINNLRIGDKFYYQVRKECNSTLFDLYDIDLNIISEKLDSLKVSFYEDGYYLLDNKTIKKYDSKGKEISKKDYDKEILELHDGFALMRDSKSLYILDLSDDVETKVNDLTEENENVNEGVKGSFNGKYFQIDHHGEISIKLRIRNISYNIKKHKVV